MKAGWFKKMVNASITIHGMFYVITLLSIVLLIPATAIAKYDQFVSFELFRLYIYPAAVAFWWKWIG